MAGLLYSPGGSGGHPVLCAPRIVAELHASKRQNVAVSGLSS
jgi:hypothetical protein